MKKILLIIVTLHLSVTHAVADIDLYSGEVLVSSQAAADRNRAVPEAFIQVLQKLSGQREIPSLQHLMTHSKMLTGSCVHIDIPRWTLPVLMAPSPGVAPGCTVHAA